MPEGPSPKPFKTKAFVSWLTALSFVGMTVSGLVLFFSPRGRYLRSHDWLVFGLDRGQWNDQHLVFSLLFIVAGIWHLYLNWGIFLGYLKRRLPGLRRFGLRPDWVLALLLSVWTLVGTIQLWPPFHWIPEAREWAKHVWERSPSDSADPPPMSGVDEWLSSGGGGRGYGGGQGQLSGGGFSKVPQPGDDDILTHDERAKNSKPEVEEPNQPDRKPVGKNQNRTFPVFREYDVEGL